MSTICLAAQRSYTTGEAVWFSYRLPSMKTILTGLLSSLMCLCAMFVVGVYAHIYRELQHPAAPPVKPAKVVTPETQLSDMHYVYVSKPFPQAKPEPIPMESSLPAMENSPVIDNDANWQQAPDDGRVDQPLPDTHEEVQTPLLQERFMQAVKEQQLDYSQGKIPPQPEDETIDTLSRQQKSPPVKTEGDEQRGSQ